MQYLFDLDEWYFRSNIFTQKKNILNNNSTISSFYILKEFLFRSQKNLKLLTIYEIFDGNRENPWIENIHEFNNFDEFTNSTIFYLIHFIIWIRNKKKLYKTVNLWIRDDSWCGREHCKNIISRHLFIRQNFSSNNINIQGHLKAKWYIYVL